MKRNIEGMRLEQKYLNDLILATPSGDWRNKLTERNIELDHEMRNDVRNMSGSLFLTSGGRIVLDDHGNECYALPYDRELMTKEELTNGIRFDEFMNRMNRIKKMGR